MRFLTPWGFLALLAIPLILLLYLLKKKYRKKEIPSLSLWKKAFPETKAQEPWQKLRKSLLLFLQLAAAALFAFALAGPYAAGGMQAADYVLALDCSMSMQATDVENSRFEAAKKEMEHIIQKAPRESVFSLIALGEEPRTLLSASSNKEAVLTKLEDIQPSFGGVDWETGERLLKTEEERGGELLLFTDDYGQLETVSPREYIFNGQGENTAVTLLSYREQEEGLLVLTQVRNFGTEPAKRTLTLFADGVAYDTAEVELAAGEGRELTFSAVPEGTKSLMAKLFPEDELAADDVMYQGVASASRQKALLVTEQNLFLEKALSVMEQIELYKTTPENSETLSGYSLYIFDGVIPHQLPEDGYILLFDGQGKSALAEAGAIQSFSGKARGTEEWQGGADAAFEIYKGTPLSASWGRSLLRADGKTIALYGELQGRKTAIFGFDLHDTDFPLTAAFPMALHGLLEWYFPRDGAGIANLQAGQKAELSLLPETEAAWVEMPSGKKVQIAPPFPPRTFGDTAETGIYTLLQQDGKSGERAVSFAVNGKAGEESDLSLKGTASSDAGEEKGKIQTGRDLRNGALLFLLLLLILEWRVNCREH